MESIQKFEPNIVSIQLTKGERWWYTVGCYLAPEDALTIESVFAALRECPQGSKLLVAGYLKAVLVQPEGSKREEDIAVALAATGLEDMLAHFLLQRHPWCQDGRTLSMVKLGRKLRSPTDYILWTDRCHFRNVFVRNPRNNSDRYIVLGCLHSAPLREQPDYLRRCTRLPL